MMEAAMTSLGLNQRMIDLARGTVANNGNTVTLRPQSLAVLKLLITKPEPLPECPSDAIH